MISKWNICPPTLLVINFLFQEIFHDEIHSNGKDEIHSSGKVQMKVICRKLNDDPNLIDEYDERRPYDKEPSLMMITTHLSKYLVGLQFCKIHFGVTILKECQKLFLSIWFDTVIKRWYISRLLFLFYRLCTKNCGLSSRQMLT